MTEVLSVYQVLKHFSILGPQYLCTCEHECEHL